MKSFYACDLCDSKKLNLYTNQLKVEENLMSIFVWNVV